MSSRSTHSRRESIRSSSFTTASPAAPDRVFTGTRKKSEGSSITDTHLCHTIDVGGLPCATILAHGVREHLAEPFAYMGSTWKEKYQISSVGAKGLGMLATTDIPVHSSILIEHPVLMIPAFPMSGALNTQTLNTLVDRLPQAVQREVMSLANCQLHGTIEGIIQTNAIDIDLFASEGHMSLHRGIFLQTSRCNHSCDANAVWTWSANTLTLELRAARPIRAGDEITVSYVEWHWSRQERRKKLKECYGVDCACAICSLPKDAVARSNQVRVELKTFWERQPSFRQWCRDPALPADALIEAHKRALEIIEQERLPQALGGEHVDGIIACYGALGDVEQFWAWVQRLRVVWLVRRPEAALAFAKWLSNPQCFPLWEARKRMMTTGVDVDAYVQRSLY